MGENLILRGAKVFCSPPKSGIYADILIKQGKIEKIGRNIKKENGVKEIDLKGCYIFPGFIDMHVHSRQPGREDEETIKSLLFAAAKGGFVGVLSMPNTYPPIDEASGVFLMKKLSENEKNYLFVSACLTKQAGSEVKLVDMGELREAGCIAISDDGNPTQDSSILALALKYASMFSLLVITHCEDTSLSKEGQINEGYIASLLGLKGIPKEAETNMVQRNINLAKLTSSGIHLTHISTKEAKDMIKRAKKEGLNITADVTPHHIFLDETSFIKGDKLNYDTNLKVNPPLRKIEDKEELWEGLKDGTIDVIASDHAPHTSSEKEQEFELSPFGVIGLETTASATYTTLVKKNILTVEEWAAKLSSSPAKILNLASFGELKEGEVANITVFNPNLTYKVSAEDIASKSKNSWCIGYEFSGRVVLTIAGGEIIWALL